MTEQELSDKLYKIGYTTLWLDSGVLTIDYLNEQVKVYDNSDDKNTEHYRYATFSNYLSSKTELSDIEFENYLKLTFEDNNPLMAGSATADVFYKINLTEEQFERLCKTIGHFGKWTEKLVTRQILLRQIKSLKFTDGLFDKCIENGDSVIHEYILDIANGDQLQELAVKGKSKKIRNTASQKLKNLFS